MRGSALNSIKILLFSALAIYIAANLYAYVIQDRLLYFPAHERLTPRDVGLESVQEVTLTTKSGSDFTSWYGRAIPGHATILFFHGNGGAIAHRDYRFRELMANGFGIFMLGYPGYGGNEGKPSEQSFTETATVAYEYLLDQKITAEDIVIYGESIGSGVAVQIAAGNQARALILEAPLTSTMDVARVHYPWLLARFLLSDKFASIDQIDGIQMPLLVIHGDQDTIIPISLGRKLFERASEPKTFVALEGAGHNDLHRFSVTSIVSDYIETL